MKTRTDVQTPEEISRRFARSLEWATEHTQFPHRCVDGRTYRASCLVSDPETHRVALGYLATPYIPYMRIRAGTVISRHAGTRGSDESLRYVVITPCCNVTYRIDAQAAHTYSLYVKCGKNINGRGNRPGANGCGWPYDLTIRPATAGGFARSIWVARRD